MNFPIYLFTFANILLALLPRVWCACLYTSTYDLRIFLFLIMVKGMRGSVRVVVVVRGSYANKFEQ